MTNTWHETLGGLDASFLHFEDRTAHMHVGWAAKFRVPSGDRAPGFEQLRAHIESRLGRAPRYRQKLAEVPLGLSDPVWVDATVVELARDRGPDPRLEHEPPADVDRDREAASRG